MVFRLLFTVSCLLLFTSAVVGQINIAFATTDVTCTGDADGILRVTPSGGTAPYTVRITQTAPPTGFSEDRTAVAEGQEVTFTNLTGGNYNIAVFDAVNNSASEGPVEILEPNVSVEIEVVDGFRCFDDAEGGSLQANIFDGTNQIDPSDYSFSWNTGATTRRITGLTPGRYEVTATNNTTGCTTDVSINFRAPNRLQIRNTNATTDPATCNSSPDGTIDIEITGGTQNVFGEYTLEYSDRFFEDAARIRRTDLLPGQYTVKVTDANSCEAETTFIIQAEKTLVLNAAPEDVSCFGDADGSISVTATTTGTAAADLPFVATLLNETGTQAQPPRNLGDGTSPEVFSGLGPGTYIVVLRDSDPAGCETRDTFALTEPEPLTITGVETQDVGCPDTTGRAIVGATGGTLPYTFRFVNESLADPSGPSGFFEVTTPATEGDSVGVVEGLIPSPDYYVVVTDGNGCETARSPFVITRPPEAIVQFIQTDSVSCPNATDGQLTVRAQPPPNTDLTIAGYAWYPVNPDGSLGDQIVTGRTTEASLAVGTYAVEITLSNGCITTEQGEVVSPGLVRLEDSGAEAPTCRGESNGFITVIPTGGTPNADGTYNYEWTSPTGNDIPPANPTTPNQITGLAAGEYRLVITDANNCQPAFDTVFTLEEPVGIEGEFTVEDVSCPDPSFSDGSATFSARLSDNSPSTFDFDFFGNNNDQSFTDVTEASVDNLTRGVIFVNVTVTFPDRVCTRQFEELVGSPDNFEPGVETGDVSCAGEADGVATISLEGGTPGYTYELLGQGAVDARIEGLPAGFYEVVATDANGCTSDNIPIFIVQPQPLVLAIDPVLTTPLVTRNGDGDGVIAVEVVSEDNNPLRDNPYRWSPRAAGRGDAIASELGPGTYTVSVTDVRGCSDTVRYTIGEPSPVTFTLDPVTPPICFGETTTINVGSAQGGQAASLDQYNFTINNDGFLIPVTQQGTTFAGEDIVVTVFDSVGCSAATRIDIDQPEEIVIDIEERFVIELGDSTTRLDPVVTPAATTYNYVYSPPIYLSDDSIRDPLIFPLLSQFYTLQVSDADGCKAITDFFVQVDANRNVYIPNAISPNGDGRNEFLRVFGCQGVVNIDQVNIYNRWGGLVSEISDLPPSCQDGTIVWNGRTPDGERVNNGVYAYTMAITFLDGETLTYRGDVTIVR